MDPATLRFLLTQVPTAALALVGLYLFTTGKLHSNAELRQVRKDLETERAAHEQTRAALALANARADAGIRAAELVASAVERGAHGTETETERQDTRVTRPRRSRPPRTGT